VPHAFGFKAMNLPFCLWLKSIPQERVTVMFHEVAFPVEAAQSLKHNLLGLITRLMARSVSRSAGRIMVASERWRTMLMESGVTAPISWVPIPSTIPVRRDLAATAQWRLRSTTAGGPLVGHFADYSDYAVKQLSHLIPAMLAARPDASVLFLGKKSGELRRRVVGNCRHLHNSIHATGLLPAPELSAALAACDVMVQPYPDGVSTRRSTTSALLAHGCAIVTTKGVATERLWSDSAAVVVAAAEDSEELREKIVRLLASPELLHSYSNRALELYDRRFALRHTIAALLADNVPECDKRSDVECSATGYQNKFGQ
jgi:hypothetical protein